MSKPTGTRADLAALITRKTRALRSARRNLNARLRELEAMQRSVKARETELAALRQRYAGLPVNGARCTTMFLDDVLILDDYTAEPTPEQRAAYTFWAKTNLNHLFPGLYKESTDA